MAQLKINHVFSDYTPNDPDAQRRHNAAYATWVKSGFNLLPFKGERNSSHYGDRRKTPFIHDMLEHAFDVGCNAAVLSNNDVVLDNLLGDGIAVSCQRHGCYWAYRIPHIGGQPDCGIDLFAMTPEWWKVCGNWFPDLLLGYRWWDNIMRRLMIMSGCDEQQRLYYHEPHQGIEGRNDSPGEIYNQWVAKEWLRVNGERE